jgi:hypothetical protein
MRFSPLERIASTRRSAKSTAPTPKWKHRSSPASAAVAALVPAIQLEDQSAPKRCGHFAGKELITAEEISRSKGTIIRTSNISSQLILLPDIHKLLSSHVLRISEAAGARSALVAVRVDLIENRRSAIDE